MMSEEMRKMLDLKELEDAINGVHNPNADAYRAKIRKEMETIPEYAYLDSLDVYKFKSIDEIYETMFTIQTEEELEARISRSPEAQQNTFRRIWKQIPGKVN